MLEGIDANLLTPKYRAILSKINLLYILGQLIDLPTLHSILEHKNIKSNHYQIDFNRLLKKMGHRTFLDLFEMCFKQNIESVLYKMSQKQDCIWSKELVTVILDDSIFKQWLKDILGIDKHYACFYSGQYNSSVYGFKVLCLGVSIDGVFYPLFLDFVPGKQADSEGKNTALNAHDFAQKLVAKWGEFVCECIKKGISIPALHLSCDSGYSNVALSEKCEQNHLIYISVPKKSHYFTIDNEKKKLSDFALDFEKIENEYIENCKQNNQTIKPFSWRIKAHYQSQNRTVILLFFRLNNSRKISVIYSNKLTIFQKTLRRHWFNRTQIEQFFKLLKHSMKIQNSLVRTKERFEKKLYQFMFIAFYLQQFTRHLSKQFNFGCKRKMGFEGLKRQKALRDIISEILDGLLQTKMTVNNLLSSI